jgi:hypothetical protein
VTIYLLVLLAICAARIGWLEGDRDAWRAAAQEGQRVTRQAADLLAATARQRDALAAQAREALAMLEVLTARVRGRPSPRDPLRQELM